MPAAPFTDIAEAIRSRLATVPNVGLTYPTLKNIRDIEDHNTVLNLCYDPNQERIAVWFITRVSIPEEQLTSLQNERISEYIFHGYMARSDQSDTETIFQTVIDNVCAAFRPQDNLDGLVEKIYPVQVPIIDHAYLKGSAEGEILCHHAECHLRVQEFFSS